MSAASRLYEQFKGAVAKRFMRTGVRVGDKWVTRRGNINILIPSELAVIGHVRAIEYDCVRDGKRIEARHPFAPGSRPIFAVGTRRGELFMITSSSKFTDRGILDFNRHGQAVDFDEDRGRIILLK